MNVMIGNAVQVFQERMTTVADHAARVFRENGYTVAVSYLTLTTPRGLYTDDNRILRLTIFMKKYI
jgi:hypothetical protein